MPSIEFDVWCGVCGTGICNETDVTGSTITVSCPTCADRIAELESENDSLEQQIDSLYNDINTLKDDL